MKTINFLCTQCEAPRKIEINEVTIHYVMGSCTFCKARIVMNHKRLKRKIDINSSCINL